MAADLAFTLSDKGEDSVAININGTDGIRAFVDPLELSSAEFDGGIKERKRITVFPGVIDTPFPDQEIKINGIRYTVEAVNGNDISLDFIIGRFRS